jgi:hypothetical protein
MSSARRNCANAIWTHGSFERYRGCRPSAAIFADESPVVQPLSSTRHSSTSLRPLHRRAPRCYCASAGRVASLGITCSVGISASVGRQDRERCDKPTGSRSCGRTGGALPRPCPFARCPASVAYRRRLTAGRARWKTLRHSTTSPLSGARQPRHRRRFRSRGLDVRDVPIRQ